MFLFFSAANPLFPDDPVLTGDVNNICDRIGSIEIDKLTYGGMYFDDLTKNSRMGSMGHKMAKGKT